MTLALLLLVFALVFWPNGGRATGRSDAPGREASPTVAIQQQELTGVPWSAFMATLWCLLCPSCWASVCRC